MTANPLDLIEARAQAATKGPWVARTTGRSGGDHWYVCDDGESIASIHASDGEDEERREPDAVFIAAARTDVPKLVAALRAVEAVHGAGAVYEDEDSCGHAEEYHDTIQAEGGEWVCLDTPLDEQVCTECRDSLGDPQPWPCPTITAIREALG